MKFTTLWVSEKTKARLHRYGYMKETEDELMNRILDIVEKIITAEADKK